MSPLSGAFPVSKSTALTFRDGLARLPWPFAGFPRLSIPRRGVVIVNGFLLFDWCHLYVVGEFFSPARCPAPAIPGRSHRRLDFPTWYVTARMIIGPSPGDQGPQVPSMPGTDWVKRNSGETVVSARDLRPAAKNRNAKDGRLRVICHCLAPSLLVASLGRSVTPWLWPSH